MGDTADIPMHYRRTPPDPEVSGLMARLAAGREELLSVPPGPDAASRLSLLMDDTLRSLISMASRTADPGRPWAVVALGGYGAGRLLPYSDIDLLIACEARSSRLQPFVRAVLYPLWDAGLKVGHAVRGRKEALAAARDDLANRTSLLTSRLLAGSPDTFDGVVGSVAEASRHDQAALLSLLGRRERPGTAFDLWPELKEGRGGQRDLDELAWTAATLAAMPRASLSVLVQEGLADTAPVEALARAQALLTEARWWTHATHGRAFDRWTEEADVAAPAVGDRLASALALVDEVASAARVRAGRRRRRKGGGAPARADDADLSPEMFLGALADGSRSLEDLCAAARRGALDVPVPGFSAVMTLRAPGLTHRLTVGAHCVACASLITGAGAGDARAADILASIDDVRPLLVAALLHDIGKRSCAKDHGLAGAPIAREAALQLGLTGPQAAQVASLVRHHLLFPEIVASADLDDEDVMVETASLLGDPALAAPLYVLTMADTLATSPDSWTDWKATLTGELAGKVERILNGSSGADLASQAEERRDEVRELARFEQVPGAIEGFARKAPMRYLAEHPAEEVVAHARLAFTLAQGSRTDTARLEVRPGPSEGTWRVTFVALDRPGLLGLLAGVVALSGLDILSVSAHTSPLGVALDTFTVGPATLAGIEPDTWARLERSLGAALVRRLSVAARLAERRKHYRSVERKVEPSVRVDTSGDFTASFSVRAADRVGLLHDLALALASVDLDIRSVTALTAEGVARDTFRVVDRFGEAPKDEETLDTARRLLLEAVVGNPTGDAPSTRSDHESDLQRPR